MIILDKHRFFTLIVLILLGISLSLGIFMFFLTSSIMLSNDYFAENTFPYPISNLKNDIQCFITKYDYIPDYKEDYLLIKIFANIVTIKNNSTTCKLNSTVIYYKNYDQWVIPRNTSFITKDLNKLFNASYPFPCKINCNCDKFMNWNDQSPPLYPVFFNLFYYIFVCFLSAIMFCTCVICLHKLFRITKLNHTNQPNQPNQTNQPNQPNQPNQINETYPNQNEIDKYSETIKLLPNQAKNININLI